jgi:hypothetical protein
LPKDPSNHLATVAKLWQTILMGNKDAKKRETKKPPKKKPTRHELAQAAAAANRLFKQPGK